MIDGVSDDVTDGALRTAAETTLPRLYDALRAAGYGRVDAAPTT
jgi:hypothetical protein